MVEQMPERKKTGWPERSCREAVWGEWQAYACELPDMHNGPCMNLSVRASIQRRESWETQGQTAGEDMSA